MNEGENREAFEKWVSAPPREYSIDRFGGSKAWPGQYESPAVQLAWEAWQEATKLCTGPVALKAQTLGAGLVPSATESKIHPNPIYT